MANSTWGALQHEGEEELRDIADIRRDRQASLEALSRRLSHDPANAQSPQLTAQQQATEGSYANVVYTQTATPGTNIPLTAAESFKYQTPPYYTYSYQLDDSSTRMIKKMADTITELHAEMLKLREMMAEMNDCIKTLKDDLYESE